MREQGLSLLELITVLAIVSILTLSALPAIGEWQRELTLQTSTQTLMRSLALARQEAVVQGARVHLTNNQTWEKGWTIFADRDSDAIQDDDEPLILSQGAISDIRIRGNSPVSHRITYRENGASVLPNGGMQLGTITLCAVPATARGYAIRIAKGGRARIEQLPASVCME